MSKRKSSIVVPEEKIILTHKNTFEPVPTIDYTDENTIIFSSVRMNPPTPGHLHLIDTLINIATSINISKVYLILSKTHDCDNPLTCNEKKHWLSQLIAIKNYGRIFI
jgi:hypothetical protein